MRKILKENMLIEVHDPESNLFFKSIIQEVNPENIAIGIPMKEQKQLVLHEGTTWSFRLQLDNALYYFKSKAIGRKYSNRLPLYLIAWPNEEEIERRQRREHFRLPVVLDLQYWVLQENKDRDDFSRPDSESGEESAVEAVNSVPLDPTKPMEKLVRFLGEPERGIAADLSGGGMLMVLTRRIPPGSLVGLRLFLKDKGKEKVVLIKGSVVRAVAADKKNTRFRHGVQFIEMTPRVQEEIVRFIFTRSREKMR